MTARRSLCALALAAAAAGAWAEDDAAAFAPPAGYRLVWADEFDTDGLPNPRKWLHDTVRNREGWHNRELQYYAHAGEGNAVVRGGRLLITARRETPAAARDWGGQHYTSARLITRGLGEWTYGFVEVSARLPCGRGSWPAIWTLGSGGRWPEDGELDIMEHVGRRPDRVSSAVHTQAGHGDHGLSALHPLPTACSAFHRYQMHWTPEGVSFGVDGFEHLYFPRLAGGNTVWPFDRPQFLLLNLAIGGHLGGAVDDAAFPLTMEVDYVRVWQAPAAR